MKIKYLTKVIILSNLCLLLWSWVRWNNELLSFRHYLQNYLLWFYRVYRIDLFLFDQLSPKTLQYNSSPPVYLTKNKNRNDISWQCFFSSYYYFYNNNKQEVGFSII